MVNYNTAILQAARRRGLSARLFCQVGAPAEAMAVLEAQPLFRLDRDMPAAMEEEPLFRAFHTNGTIFRDLQDLEPLISPRTTLFVQQITDLELPGLAQWWASLPIDRRPRLVVCLRFYVENPFTSLYGVAIMALAAAGSRVRFCTDTVQLADYFGQGLARKPDIIPIPHVSPLSVVSVRTTSTPPDEVPPSLSAQLQQLHSRPGMTVVGLSLGSVGVHKGFLMVHNTIKTIRAARLPVHFIVQAKLGPHVVGDRSLLKAHIKRLQADRGADLLLIDEALDEAAYRAVLESCDILVMPYIAEVYRYNSSGIFAEAIAAAKPVIVPQHTWMGHELLRHNAAGVALHDLTPAAIAQAVAAIIANRATLEQRARVVAESWIAFHNAERLVDYLVADM